MVDYKH